ncbi:MAG TPA: DNA methyltransferase, partial [Mycobacterium sp.]|nr:DNA methyltransferase [Mycobacterium sp.]
MHPVEFQRKWRHAAVTERSGAQQHFLDLCELVGAPKPMDVDPDGAFYTFERGAEKLDGSNGWADVWYRDHFAWEYKGPGRDLAKAYRQLNQYRENLDNPPLLVVSDLDTIEVHTNFTGTAKQVHRLTLDTIGDADSLRVLRALFFAPDELRPTDTPEAVTKAAAERFGELAKQVQARGHDPQAVAHFLVQLLFCLFAEDIGLLPNRIFSRMLSFARQHPGQFRAETQKLLEAMGSGGTLAYEVIPHFNGGLFRDVDAIELTPAEIDELDAASRLDWSQVEPAIFGTLFERSLDPVARSQYGIHYTGRDDIERVVEPVVLAPLRRRWEAVQTEIDDLVSRRDAAKTAKTRGDRQRDIVRALDGFTDELAGVTILDPACGSGNFLYVALNGLLDLEKGALAYAAGTAGLPMGFPKVGPQQVTGMELNAYAQELAQVVIWIGYLQWMIGNGFGWREPVLRDLDTIRLQDALIDTRNGSAQRTAWPAAQFIIGNPPFLGDKVMGQELGMEYVGKLRSIYKNALPAGVDLACYFFEQAREAIEENRSDRAGLLATNSIRGGANRRILDRIKESGDIFMAWSDEEWVLAGAQVRISIVGFDDGQEEIRELNGESVRQINADLTSTTDITQAARLPENRSIAFLGVQKGGPFDIPGTVAREWLNLPVNPNGQSNSDVIKPRMNGYDIMRRNQDNWIVDFGPDMTEAEAAMFERPFEHVLANVKPKRDTNPRRSYREKWWIHTEPRQGLRAKLKGLERFICTPTVSKYRVFVWANETIVPDHQLIVFAREDDYFFGVLHSRAHEVWSLRMGTWLGKGNDPRYTPTTTFETFPLPWPPGEE